MVARAGFVAIVPDYRLACGTPSTPRRAFGLDYSTGGPRCGGRFDDQVDDVLAVVRHVRAHAGTLQVDSSRVGLIGVSAGGHLAMLAAERGGRATRIQAVVNVSGPTATGFIRRQAARPQLPARTIRASFTNVVGCHPTACIRRWRAADPTIQLWRLPRSVRVLAIAGARETQVPLATMRDFQRRAARAGRSVEVVAGPGACHGAGCLYGRRPIAGPTPLAQTRSFLIDTLR
jgi:acetyl esterase/lipase